MREFLKISNVTKTYGEQIVLNEVNLSINQGEIIGLVGPNGAGKTTLMKIIARLIKKYDGDVYINNENIKTNKKYDTKQIGCVIETPGFYPELTGYENLLFFSEISGLKDKDELNEIIDRLGIREYINKKAKNYSLGMKQRLGVAQAVLSYPKVLILDEPTNGLDPAIVPQLREFIKYIAREKKTAVLISSHILSEIELICDKVAFIQKGKIIKFESLKKENKDTINMAFVTSKLEELKIFFNKKNYNYKILGEDKLQLEINPKNLDHLVLNIGRENIPLRGVYEVKESLEEKYLKTMEEK
ncbi:ABC transporter ATP-binding protein [Clostridium niameyense]|uniref:ABC transporter ATP-binding protein n=1 Tax=Clostridium niameyense TaxID=1622073 RepID=A0A6M0RD28_9CLOT|nr:ABC transporter ATP-binding protein [Clostridium niameyense]NEZ47128.1 ABC transporter ATP-binding protein [Clostridium niameyense]